MSKFSMDDYVDVAHRLVSFRKKHPEGSLQPADQARPYTIETIGSDAFVVYVAAAYRTPDDIRPGIGIAWEPFPGRTPYTKNSELMNAETSAWGRAIIAALAADAKKGIASAEEVRNRAEETEAPPSTSWPSSRISSPPAPSSKPTPDVNRPIPPCSQCGRKGQRNPAHERNDRAPQFHCGEGCEDKGKNGQTYAHGFNYATDAQIRAASASLNEWADEIVRAKKASDKTTALENLIRPVLITTLGLPDTRRAWSRDHAGKFLDAWSQDRDGLIATSLPLDDRAHGDGGQDDIAF